VLRLASYADDGAREREDPITLAAGAASLEFNTQIPLRSLSSRPGLWLPFMACGDRAPLWMLLDFTAPKKSTASKAEPSHCTPKKCQAILAPCVESPASKRGVPSGGGRLTAADGGVATALRWTWPRNTAITMSPSQALPLRIAAPLVEILAPILTKCPPPPYGQRVGQHRASTVGDLGGLAIHRVPWPCNGSLRDSRRSAAGAGRMSLLLAAGFLHDTDPVDHPARGYGRLLCVH